MLPVSSAPALLLLFATAPISQAKLLTGSLDSRESWAFLDSFCFSRSGPGIITGTIHTREDGGQLLLYNDVQEASWPAVGAMSASCERRVNASANIQQLHNASRGTEFQWKVMPRPVPHEWFVAVAQCGSRVRLSYELSLLNDGPWWKRQFGCELAGVLPMYSSYCLALTMMLMLLLAVGREVRRAEMLSAGLAGLHGGPNVPALALRLGTAAAACGAAGALFTAAHFGVYARRGYGEKALPPPPAPRPA